MRLSRGVPADPRSDGVAVLSKIKPIAVKTNFQHNRTETRGRFLSVEFEHFFVVAIYAPNSHATAKFLPNKLRFNEYLEQYLQSVRPTGKKVSVGVDQSG
jgi:exodeoxyribonuclease-3